MASTKARLSEEPSSNLPPACRVPLRHGRQTAGQLRAASTPETVSEAEKRSLRGAFLFSGSVLAETALAASYGYPPGLDAATLAGAANLLRKPFSHDNFRLAAGWKHVGQFAQRHHREVEAL